MCIASFTSPNVPSPMVLLSTNCPICISLPLGIGKVGGKLPDHLRRFAMALSPRADPLRLGAGWGVCAITSPSQAVSHRAFHFSCIRYAHEREHCKFSHICITALYIRSFLSCGFRSLGGRCAVSSTPVGLFDGRKKAVSEKLVDLI